MRIFIYFAACALFFIFLSDFSETKFAPRFRTHLSLCLGCETTNDSFSRQIEPLSFDFPTYGTLERDLLRRIVEASNASPQCVASFSNSHLRLMGVPSCLEVGSRYTATLFIENESSGLPRNCSGDYFEVLLYGGGKGSTLPSLLKRPWIYDTGFGNYTVELHVPDLEFLVGMYDLKIHLLFSGGSGFGLREPLSRSSTPARLQDDESDLIIKLNWSAKGTCEGTGGGDSQALPANLAKSPRVCNFASMQDPAWRGYWLRAPEEYGLGPCKPPYCAPQSAPILSVMNDNTDLWVYRREDCVFRIMHPLQSRQCVDGKTILGIGDSNLQDTMRNFMIHALQVDPGFFIPNSPFFSPFTAPNVARTFNFSKTFPATVSAEPYGELQQFSLALGMIFSGHYDITVSGGEGIRTYLHAGWLDSASAWWRSYKRQPDFLIVNDAGLHTCQWAVGWGDKDGMGKVQNYTENYALPWLLGPHPVSGNNDLGPAPRLIFRNNVVPGHVYRGLNANPQSLEAVNAITAKALLKALKNNRKVRDNPTFQGISTAAFIDAYDMTFPFHYFDFYSDGSHYGRPIFYLPDGRNTPLLHFVDDMMTQTIISAMCG